MIENNDELGSPTACIKHSIETLKISETQDSHSQLNKFSNSLMLNSEVMGKILNEQKTSTLHPNQEIDFKKNLQEVKIRLQGIINTVKDKLKSKSKISSHVKKRNEELEELFRDFSTSPKEFSKSLDNIKKNLSKKLSEEEIKALCQTKIELVKLTELSKQVQTEPQSQIQISPKSN
jgi:predicted nuclease with TOPRIM domain